MCNHLRKSKEAFIFLLLLVWTIISMAGCGGNKNVPSASILTRGEVTLMWKDIDGSVVYNIYTSKLPHITVSNSYKIPNVNNPFTITRLEPGATYYFMVTAVDSSGRIWKSNEKSYTVGNTKGSIQLGDLLSHPVSNDNTPKSTQKVKTDAGNTRDVTLAWQDVPNATSYNIYWSDKPGVAKKNGIKITNVKSPHKITGLKKGKRYYFVVTAVSGSTESKESEEISYFVGQ